MHLDFGVKYDTDMYLKVSRLSLYSLISIFLWDSDKTRSRETVASATPYSKQTYSSEFCKNLNTCNSYFRKELL